ncbi:MAG: hypothetical protein R3330_02480, partial [Saprospiraceae bacterium]|nr:hypothetical protein [Saprospiraceae bacterium]
MWRIAILFGSLALWGCSATPGVESGELPDNLTELRTLHKDKQTQIKQLTTELEAIDAKIRQLDPAAESARRLVTTSPVTRKD